MLDCKFIIKPKISTPVEIQDSKFFFKKSYFKLQSDWKVALAIEETLFFSSFNKLKNVPWNQLTHHEERFELVPQKFRKNFEIRSMHTSVTSVWILRKFTLTLFWQKKNSVKATSKERKKVVNRWLDEIFSVKVKFSFFTLSCVWHLVSQFY